MRLPGSIGIFGAERFLALILLFACAACPVLAGSQYLYGSPDLSVSIAGTNEYSPGDDIVIPIIIANTGVNEYKYISPYTFNRDDLPDTAKHLTVTLLSGDAPVAINSDPLMAGDLASGNRVTAAFDAKTDAGAPAGTYRLLVNLNYTYLQTAEQFGTDEILYTYAKESVTVPVIVTIKPVVTIDVARATPEDLNTGSTGYLDIRVKNTGSVDGKNAVARITRNGNSPVIPLDSSVFIGDFPAGTEAFCRYRVSVDSGAEASTYPVDIAVVYETPEGDTVTSLTRTLGITVGKKITFAIISPPAGIHPGEKREIAVEYRNTGDIPVYSAQGRIMVVDPFTSSEDIVYLGDIAPGASATAVYRVSADSDAMAKDYGIDSEIRYLDLRNATYVSNTMKLEIDVTNRGGFTDFVSDPARICIIAAGIIGILYMIYRRRKKIS